MARQERFVNGVSTTTLTSSINATQTNIPVVSTSSFPSEGDFRIIIDAEIMLVTTVSGSTFTAVRGADNTVSATHSSSTAVDTTLTKGAIRAYIRDRDPWCNARPPYTIKDSSGDLLTASDFSQVNYAENAASADVDGNITITKDDHTTTSISALVRTAPSTPYSITAAIEGLVLSDFSVGGPYIGCCFRETSSGEIITHSIQPSLETAHRVIHWTSPTTGGTVIVSAEPTIYKLPVWFRFEDNGTNLTWYTSFDGVNFQFQGTEARGARFTTGPDQIGFFINNDDGVDGNFVSLVAWDGE